MTRLRLTSLHLFSAVTILAAVRVAVMAARGAPEVAVHLPSCVSPVAGALQRADPRSLGAGRPPIMRARHGATGH